MYALTEHPIVRIIPIALAALLVTLGLFLCMHLLIAMERSDVIAPKPPTRFNFIMPELKPEVLKTVKKVEPLPPPEMAPDTPVPTVDPVDGPRIAINIGEKIVFEPVVGPNNGTGVLDGSVIAQVRVAPIYPERARTRGIEGYVDLSFTVQENGVVSDVLVVDAQPKGIFDRAAVKAVKKWRYRPRIVGGEPMVTENIETRMTFKLD